VGNVEIRPVSMAFWTVLTETPRCRAYARWLMFAMQRFLNFPLAFRGDRSDESSCADHPPKGKAPR
jgi:hypothetical protein